MPGIAPRYMAWRRRMGAVPAPYSASAEASTGDPVQVEIYINGAWVDVTSYVMVRDDSGNISITRGRRDEGSQTEQSTLQMTLNNRDARWSPRNPSGPYYGVIGRNTPVRVSVPDGLGGKSYRFQGEISTWPQAWDTTGTDVYTEVEGAGILRRLSQGPASAHSVLYDALTSPISDNLRAYWPIEDAEGATSIASALPNGSPMTYTGSPTFASYEGFPASDPVPVLGSTTLVGGVPRYSDPTATQVRFFCYIPADGYTTGKVICSIDQEDYSAGSTQFWELYYGNFAGDSKSFTLRTCSSDGSNLGADLEHTYDVRGKRLYVSVEFQESGTGISRTIRLYDLDTQNTYTVTSNATLTQLTRVTKVQFGPSSRSVIGPTTSAGLPSASIAHVTVEDTITSITILGVHLYPIGEKAGRRVQRICGEEGIPFESQGDLDQTVAMGNQGRLNPLSLMQECELADAGMLYESMPVLGLGYRTRLSLCNQDPQLVLNYAGYNLSEVPTPVEDDRYIQNKVTVTVNDVSQTYELASGDLSTELPPAGVGVYGDDVTLNLASTAAGDLRSQAAWRVHLGTVDEPRYPSISVNLAHSTFTDNPALKQAVLRLRQGDRIQIQNPPVWLPPGSIDQIILGFEEQITNFEHHVTFVCAPASPYNLGILDDLILGRIDTDGSVLAADATSTATTITVSPATGQTGLWTTDTADFPFDIRVGGEVMTVTAITGGVSDGFNRTQTSGWGTTDTGESWTTTGGSSSDYSVVGV